MKLFFIEFCPLRIPLERRLQTLSICYLSYEFFFLPFIYTFICVLLLFTKYYYISLIYLIYLYLDLGTPTNGGRMSNWIRSFKFWGKMLDYFPVKTVKTCELDVKRNYLFGVHPHGITSTSTVLNFCYSNSSFYEHFPDFKNKIKLATIDSQFIFPVHRDLLLFLGLVSSNKESITNILKNNENLALVVGGAPEALSTKPDHIKLYLKNRKGFIKLAIENGASLVPVFQFGENEIWRQKEFQEGSWFRKFQRLFTDYLKFSPPVFHGRGIYNYTFGFLPFRKPLTTVVGKPINVDKKENPTREEVDNLHKKYVESLIDLFEEYNPQYGRKEAKIEIY